MLIVPATTWGRAEAQVRLEVRAGYAQSGTILRDPVATPLLRQALGRGVQEEVTATFAGAPRLGAGVAVPMRGSTEVTGTVSWTPTSLQATDDEGTRDVQDVAIVEGVLGARARVWRAVEISGGFGGIMFSSEDRGMFAGGADVAPLLEGGVGSGWTRGGHQVRVRALAQLHRFSTAALESSRASGGTTVRYGLEGSFTWNGGAR